MTKNRNTNPIIYLLLSAAIIIIILAISFIASCIPDNYTKAVPWTDYSLVGLKEVVGNGFVFSSENFDCSQKSSYLLWKLQNRGFQAKIDISHHFGGSASNCGHAWIEVIIRGKTYYIETLNHKFDNMLVDGSYYQHWERQYSTIEEAIQGEGIDEWSWWNSIPMR
jgi:hypothetical protein